MAQLDYVLQALNVYVESIGKLGWCEKLTTPKLKKKTEKFRGGGMLGDRNMVLGYEAIDFDFSLNAYDPELIKQAGLFSKNGRPIAFTEAFDGDGGAQHAASFTCRGTFEEIDGGSHEPGKKAMLVCKGTLVAAKLVMDGATLYDIDFQADKYIVGGVDEYAWIKAAL